MCMLVASKSPMQNTYLGLSFFIPEALDHSLLCVDSNYMHIYAFIVLHMQLNVFSVYICTYTHIFTPIVCFYMKIPHFKIIVPIICIWESIVWILR